MHYVSAVGLSKSYGIKSLFQEISFNIEENDKVAIIARNGSGKSTLLRILAGKESPDEGEVWINKDLTVVFFEQEPAFLDTETVAENIFHHDHPVMNAIRNFEIHSAEGDVQKIAESLALMDQLNAWEFEFRIQQILSNLNINLLQQKVGELSGGQKKRLALARTLIDIGFESRHILLLMDEPTNHLDVEMVEWLEKYLTKESVTILLVTHDRYFLDSVCSEIWEIDHEKLFTYTGDYDNYLEKKIARIENDASGLEKLKNLYRKELEWIRKQPRARTSKSKSRQQHFHILESKAHQRTEDQTVELQMKMNRLGGKTAEFKKVYKSFGEKVVLKGFDYNFKRNERVGIIGKNGVGKSTFIKLLQGLELADSGKINTGETVVFGHYSQDGLFIKEDMRVIEFVKNIAENFPLASGGVLNASQFLQMFLFSPDAQYTYLSSLSGGEKRRLQLLSVLYCNPNFLILDEPTNDLDLPTLGVLEDFLSAFLGCLIVISHDRYFMDRLVDHLLIMEGNGDIRDFPGNYSQFRLQEDIPETSAPATKPTVSVKKEASTAQQAMEKKRLSYKEQRELELLNKEIDVLTIEKKTIIEKLETGGIEFDELQRLSTRISKLVLLLDEKEMRWLELNEWR